MRRARAGAILGVADGVARRASRCVVEKIARAHEFFRPRRRERVVAASMTTRLARASIDARVASSRAVSVDAATRARGVRRERVDVVLLDGTRERADVDDAKREAARTTEAHAKSFRPRRCS